MSQAPNEVSALYTRYSEAYLQADVAALDAILADDWILITAGCGDEVGKVGQLKDLANGVLQVHAIDDSEVTYRTYGDAAVVTGRRQAKVTYKNRDVGGLTRFSQFYARQAGAWRCVSTQVSDISEEADLVPVFNRYNEAYLQGDAGALGAILVDDWILITAGCGDDVGKASQLEDLANGTLQVHAIQDTGVKFRVYGDAAVVTGRRQAKVTYKNRDVGGLTNFSQFYVRQDGSWRCVSTQVTDVGDQPAAAAG